MRWLLLPLDTTNSGAKGPFGLNLRLTKPFLRPKSLPHLYMYVGRPRNAIKWLSRELSNLESLSRFQMSHTVPNWGAAYEDLGPAMVGALGKLARQGFVVSPADASDLIHDFFVERWQNLVDNYDPRKGSFEGYSYVAFVHFARPRIVRLQRLQSCVVSPEELEALPSPGNAEEDFAAAYDRKIMRQVISKLPDPHKYVLTMYIYSSIPSERELANKLRLSRYRVREILVEALGLVTASLDKPKGLSERDWKVALSLWRDRRTIMETASFLGKTTHQIRRANSRNVHALAEALRSYEPHKGPRTLRRITMNAAPVKPGLGMLSAGELFEQTLRSSGNYDLLKQVCKRATEVMAVLKKPESVALSDWEIEELDPRWIGEVYETLSKASSDWTTTTTTVTDGPFYAYTDDERKVGLAFAQALIADLPDRLRDPHRWLGGTVEKVDESERKFALATPSTRGAMANVLPGESSEARSMAEYGVTPMMVLRSTQAISFLLYRFLRKRKLTSEQIRLTREGVSDSTVDAEFLVDEIRRVAECRKTAADALYRWDIDVAQYKPYVFERFRAEVTEGGVVLTPVETRYENLFERWRFSEVAEPVPA